MRSAAGRQTRVLQKTAARRAPTVGGARHTRGAQRPSEPEPQGATCSIRRTSLKLPFLCVARSCQLPRSGVRAQLNCSRTATKGWGRTPKRPCWRPTTKARARTAPAPRRAHHMRRRVAVAPSRGSNARALRPRARRRAAAGRVRPRRAADVAPRIAAVAGGGRGVGCWLQQRGVARDAVVRLHAAALPRGPPARPPHPRSARRSFTSPAFCSAASPSSRVRRWASPLPLPRRPAACRRAARPIVSPPPPPARRSPFANSARRRNGADSALAAAPLLPLPPLTRSQKGRSCCSSPKCPTTIPGRRYST
jgi:hypothetical protein